MKRLLLMILCFIATLIIVAQNQQGYVKTPGRQGNNGKVISGKRLPGVTVQVKERSAVVSGSKGNFKFPIPTNKFFIQSVKKQGYVLVDPEATSRQYTYSTNPLILLMEVPNKQADEELQNEKKIRRTLQRKLEAKEDEIEALRQQNIITQAEYRKAMQQIYAEQESNEKLISDMAKRYSQIDFDQLDEFNQRISDYIISGRLTEVDSLLRTRGDINKRISDLNQHHVANMLGRENLEKSEAMEQQTRDEIAQDCYHFYEKFLMEHQIDSAGHYLELRASLDSTNVQWQNETGRFMRDYIANYSLALRYFQQGLQKAQTQYGEQNEWTATSYNSCGIVYYLMGDYDEALDLFLKALAIRKQELGNEHLHVAQSLNNIGLVYDSREDYYNAIEYYTNAHAIFVKALGENHPDVVKPYNNIGVVYTHIGDYQKALDYHLKALATRERVLGMKHPDVAQSLNNIGVVYTHIGDYEKALEYYFEALNVQKQLFRDEHPSIASSYSNIGNVYADLSDNTNALEYHIKALNIREHIFGSDHPDVAMSNLLISNVYMSQGDYEKALEYQLKALAIDENVYGREHLSTVTSYCNIGSVYDTMGEYDKALEYYKMAADIQERMLGSDNSSQAALYTNMGSVYFNQGNYEKALEYYTKAYSIYNIIYGPEHPMAQSAKSNIDRLNEKLDKQ